MRRTRVGLSSAALIAMVLYIAARSVNTQTLPTLSTTQGLTVAPSSLDAIRSWDAEVIRMQRDGRLRPVREREDTLLPNRQHERLAQYHGDFMVFGAEVTRQSENGVPISMLGRLYRDIDAPTTPRLSSDDARRVMLDQRGAESILGDPELLILPLDAGGYALAYRVVATFPADILVSFVDASSGRILLQFTDVQTQADVGRGRGVLGDMKKISTALSGGTYRTSDALRPPAILTYDLKGNLTRTLDVLNGRVTLGTADLATDDDNDWMDGAVVDGHVYAGWTYDYYFKRFGRRGLDNNNLAIRSVIHPVSRDNFTVAYYNQNSQFFTNAFWTTALRLMVYGVGLPPNVTLGGQSWNFVSGSVEVVAHELTHGVTQFSSNLIYRGESGALNEAFSDMMGVAAEFYYASVRGRPANYTIGDDVITPRGLRSMSNPGAFSDPDHYSRRALSSADNFGVHTNSGIPNQVYYLAIEGGTNPTSGLSVQGVGSANREQIEKIFYRAFTLMLPASANFYLARVATIQSARDLYGADSAAERAVTQAWDAVGVRAQAATLGFLFAPNSPVPPAPVGQCTLARPNFMFLVGVAETSGVAFNVSSSQMRFYNAAGALSSSQSLNFAQTFNACGPGSSRIPAAGLPCAQLCVTFGGAAGGFVDFTVAGADDEGNHANFTSQRLRLGTTTLIDSTAPFQGAFIVAK